MSREPTDSTALDYKRIYIYQVYSNLAAVYADNREKAFRKLRLVVEHWTEPEITEVMSLNEFLIEALKEGEPDGSL